MTREKLFATFPPFALSYLANPIMQFHKKSNTMSSTKLLVRGFNAWFWLVIATAHAFTVQAQPTRWTALEKTIPAMMDSAEVQGLALAVIENGKMVWQHGFGVMNIATKAPVTTKTVFQAASLSKPLFAFAVLKLVEQGKFDWDKPLLDYLPQAEFESAFLKRPLDDERMRRLTARLVLSHSTGFPNWRNEDTSLRLNFAPGAHFNYSGEGFVLLQKTIEYITRQPIQDFVHAQVFAPLKMSTSSYVWREVYETQAANGHGAPDEVRPHNKMTAGNAAYSLYTSVEEYAAFLVAMLNQKELRKKSFTQMLAPQIQLPIRWGDFSGKAEGLHWGLGWGLQRTKLGESFWHWGDNGAFKCYVVGYPKSRNGLVFFTNSVNGLTLANELVRRIMGDEQEALFRWLNYDAYNSLSTVFAKTAVNTSVDAALAQHRSSGAPRLEEGPINLLGYRLLRAQRFDEALRIFALNVENYPNSANVYDSYAEGLMRSGNRKLAAENYQKALARDPNNETAKRLVPQLLREGPASGNAHFKLSGYAQARFVTLAGEFNGWNAMHTLMMREGEDWLCAITLPPGKYRYKFVVEGKWIVDPGNPNVEKDNEGNENSVMVVE